VATVKLEKAEKQLTPKEMSERRTEASRSAILKEAESDQQARLEETAADHWKEAATDFAEFVGGPLVLAAAAGTAIPTAPVGDAIGNQSMAAHELANTERLQSSDARRKGGKTKSYNALRRSTQKAQAGLEAVDKVKGAFSQSSKEGISAQTFHRIEGIGDELEKVIRSNEEPLSQKKKLYSLRKAADSLSKSERKALYERTVRQFLRLGEKGASSVGWAGKRALALPMLTLDFILRTGPKQLLKNSDAETMLTYSALKYKKPLQRSWVPGDDIFKALQQDLEMTERLRKSGVISAAFYNEVVNGK
jgi:hypothetical protein